MKVGPVALQPCDCWRGQRLALHNGYRRTLRTKEQNQMPVALIPGHTFGLTGELLKKADVPEIQV